MLQKHLLGFLIFIFMVFGCNSTETIESTKVSPTEIYQDFVIRGSKTGTYVTATFRVGGATGSTVDLDVPSRIEHNGKEMSESKPFMFKGTDYIDSNDQFVSNHKFAFTDASGKTWENEISLEALEINSQNVVISKANGGVIALSRPVGTDENVEFSIVSEKEQPQSASNQNANIKSKTPEKAYSAILQYKFDETRKTIKIEPFSLKNFIDGKANVKVTVRRNRPAQQAAKGSSFDFNYESQRISVVIAN